MQRVNFISVRFLVILLTITLFTIACNSNDPSDTSSILRIKLTDTQVLQGDMPVIPITGLFIDIQRIEVLENEEWKAINSQGREVNLLQLTNGKLLQIAEEWFPAGRSIRGVRLVLGDNSRVLNAANQTFDLTTPNAIVIENFQIDIRLNSISSMVIELNSVFTHNNTNNTFSLNAMGRGFSESESILRGTVAPREAFAMIIITHTETDDALRAFADPENGSFTFLGVPTGDWMVEVRAHPDSRFHDSIFVDPITVTRNPRINNLGSVRLQPIITAPEPEPDDGEEEEEDIEEEI